MDTRFRRENIKKNFIIPVSLLKKVEETGEEMGLKFSQIVRNALEEYVSKVEKEKLKKELIEACKFYYSTDKEISNEWRNAESES
ncbi:MAG: hypothetical protein PVH88_19140 [Ignavibacteria bacterium]|jgi:hypothetical protein